MKRFFVVLLSIICLLFPLSAPSAVAETGQYYSVNDTAVVFWFNDYYDQEKFDIPKGCAFSVTGKMFKNGELTEVIYSGITGSVPTLALSSCTSLAALPQNPSPTLVITSTLASAYKEMGLSGENISLTGKSPVFLGIKKDTDNVEYYAVKVENGGTYGIYYVAKSNCSNVAQVDAIYNPPTVPNNSDSEIKGDPTVEVAAETPSKNNNILRIILVIGIILPALIIIFLIFRPGKRKQKQRREIETDDSDRFDDY